MTVVPGANALVDVLRDSVADDVDEYGDPMETVSGSTVLTGVPMAIFEESQRVPVDGDLRTVRVVRGRAPAGTDVRPGDRLQDADGALFSVTAVVEQKLNINRPLYVRVELVRTS